MAEREVVLDEPVMDESVEALKKATERAERAEAELRRLKTHGESSEPKSREVAGSDPQVAAGGEEELRRDSMMAHLLDSLAAGKDIGHYGRLVFAMVARHFMTHDEVLAWLRKDEDFSEEQARVMLKQVEGKGYNPPRRERILEWQGQQEFPILPDADDPDCGNLYRNLRFPNGVYAHIEEYQEAKL
jgi:hypothetical protein